MRYIESFIIRNIHQQSPRISDSIPCTLGKLPCKQLKITVVWSARSGQKNIGFDLIPLIKIDLDLPPGFGEVQPQREAVCQVGTENPNFDTRNCRQDFHVKSINVDPAFVLNADIDIIRCDLRFGSRGTVFTYTDGSMGPLQIEGSAISFIRRRDSQSIPIGLFASLLSSIKGPVTTNLDTVAYRAPGFLATTLFETLEILDDYDLFTYRQRTQAPRNQTWLRMCM